jgi:hypothetical protein
LKLKQYDEAVKFSECALKMEPENPKGTFAIVVEAFIA